MDYSDTHVLGGRTFKPSEKSFKRWCKHSFSLLRTAHFFNATDKQHMSELVNQAEHLHLAEIRVGH